MSSENARPARTETSLILQGIVRDSSTSLGITEEENGNEQAWTSY
jgi:hypothetical protein